jgi:hypothetical protein
MNSIPAFLCAFFLSTALSAALLPAYAADDGAAQPSFELALDQSPDLEQKSCSCSTGVGVCHIIYRFSGSTCEKRAYKGETECTGTCAFRTSRGGTGSGTRQ